MWYIYTMDYYSTIKNNEFLLFAATWMDFKSIMLNEKSERNKYVMSLTCEI